MNVEIYLLAFSSDPADKMNPFGGLSTEKGINKGLNTGSPVLRSLSCVPGDRELSQSW